jgi:LmbE family N-acetylglucosaminyl deacetylase
VLGLRLPPGPLSVLALGAHPDDIEIGAGGLLMSLAAARPGMRVRYVVLTGTQERRDEARAAASAFMPGAELTVEAHDLPDGRLPARWNEVKEILAGVAATCEPDLIVAPSAGDAHQDHRTVADLAPTAFRDQLHLGYELPKWDGDMGRPWLYVPLTAAGARRKIDLLHKCFPSQAAHDWWDDEVFLGLARLRGMECRSPYAEAFTCTKSLLMEGANPR